MIIPLTTDAPVYHFPFATIGLILTNVFCFLLSGMGSDEHVARWAEFSLQHGQGLHPLQWITSNFLHAGFIHLLGKMVFLWGFGLVVEGKLGWLKFVAVYLGIGVAQCAVEQTIMLWSHPLGDVHQVLGLDDESIRKWREEGATDAEVEAALDKINSALQNVDRQHIPGSLGASSIIYGMLAMSLVWAPKNEVTCLFFAGIRSFTFEITIMTLALWYIGEAILIAVIQQFSLATATLHLMGAAIGFGVGVVLFKRGLVDCEDWDLFSVMSGHYGPYARDSYGNRIDRPGDKKEIELKEVEKPKKKAGPNLSVRKKAFQSIQQLVDDGDFSTANDELYNLRLKDEKAVLDEDLLERLAIGLAKSNQWDDSIALMNEFIEAYPENADVMRLKLSQAYMKGRDDPREALQTLKSIDASSLNDDRRAQYQKLIKQAKAMLNGD